MEPQKPGNSTGPGTEVVERQQIAKERAAQRVRSWTVQNEMRGVRKCCGKDSRFCQSYRDRSLKEGCVRCSEGEREHNEHDVEAQVTRWKSREPVCGRISMRQYASSPRKEKSGYQR